MADPNHTIEFWGKVVLPILTFVLGFVVSRFTMSKAERKAQNMAAQNLSNELIVKKNERFNEFVKAMRDYAQKKEEPGLDDFCEIAQKGESYFAAMTVICDSILTSNIPEATVRNTHAPGISDAVKKSLPSFYAALQEIARKKEITYKGKLDRKQYESIFLVYEKYIDRIEPI